MFPACSGFADLFAPYLYLWVRCSSCSLTFMVQPSKHFRNMLTKKTLQKCLPEEVEPVNSWSIPPEWRRPSVSFHTSLRILSTIAGISACEHLPWLHGASLFLVYWVALAPEYLSIQFLAHAHMWHGGRLWLSSTLKDFQDFPPCSCLHICAYLSSSLVDESSLVLIQRLNCFTISRYQEAGMHEP